MRARTYLILALLFVLAGWPNGLPAQTNTNAAARPEFQEVYDLVRAHLSGINDQQLNETAVEALVKALGPRVSLVTNATAAANQAQAPLVRKSNVFDGEIAYLRVKRVSAGLADAMRDDYQKLRATNKLSGVILDLRYADGNDYAEAVTAADLFIRKEQPVLDWGEGMVPSKAKSEAISVPVAVLVNGETAGAAEALAAILRETGAGVILGSRTAGAAMITEQFPLKNGDRLRIGTAPVRLGDGSAMSSQGVKPDIAVAVPPAEEKAYYTNAYYVRVGPELAAGGGGGSTNAAGATNRVARRPRFNEAELVRERREGISEADVTALREREPEKPLVSDPALARALDLLKGLALVRQSRS
jgi:hypothetical protein